MPQPTTSRAPTLGQLRQRLAHVRLVLRHILLQARQLARNCCTLSLQPLVRRRNLGQAEGGWRSRNAQLQQAAEHMLHAACSALMPHAPAHLNVNQPIATATLHQPPPTCATTSEMAACVPSLAAFSWRRCATLASTSASKCCSSSPSSPCGRPSSSSAAGAARATAQ